MTKQKIKLKESRVRLTHCQMAAELLPSQKESWMRFKVLIVQVPFIKAFYNLTVERHPKVVFILQISSKDLTAMLTAQALLLITSVVVSVNLIWAKSPLLQFLALLIKKHRLQDTITILSKLFQFTAAIPILKTKNKFLTVFKKRDSQSIQDRKIKLI